MRFCLPIVAALVLAGALPARADNTQGITDTTIKIGAGNGHRKQLLAMIVTERHRIGPAIAPNKADAPLVIDSDRMLPRPIAMRGFKPIARRNAQVSKGHGTVDHQQLRPCALRHIA